MSNRIGRTSKSQSYVQTLARTSSQKQKYRTSRAWAILTSAIAFVVSAFTNDVYVLSVVFGIALACIFHFLYLSRAIFPPSSGSFGVFDASADQNVQLTASVAGGSLKTVTELSSSFTSPTSTLSNKPSLFSVDKSSRPMQREEMKAKSPLVETFTAMRKRTLRPIDFIQSSSTQHIENYSPPQALKVTQRVFHTEVEVEEEYKNTRSPLASHYQTNITRDLKSYHTSPLMKGTYSLSTTSNEPRKRDALQALGLSSTPEEWIDRLKGNLGRHLYAIMKFHDQSFVVLKDVLTRRCEANNITKDALHKSLRLLNHDTKSRAEHLDDGTELTVENVLRFCQQCGVPKEIIQKYEAAASFFKLCRHLQEMNERHVEDSGHFNLETLLASTASSASSGQDANALNGPKTLMQRLRELDSADKRLRIEWVSSRSSSTGGMQQHREFMSGRTAQEMWDQDIVIALFLHRCDDYQAQLTTTVTRPKSFSDMHYATLPTDVKQILQYHRQEHEYQQPQRVGSMLNMFLRSVGRDSSQGVDQQGQYQQQSFGQRFGPVRGMQAEQQQQQQSQAPHFEILRVATSTSTVAMATGQQQGEILTIDRSRSDVFEAIVILLLTIHLTRPKDDMGTEDDGKDDAGGEADTAQENDSELYRGHRLGPLRSSSLDTRVTKKIFDEVIDQDELLRLLKDSREVDQRHKQHQQQLHQQQSSQLAAGSRARSNSGSFADAPGGRLSPGTGGFISPAPAGMSLGGGGGGGGGGLAQSVYSITGSGGGGNSGRLFTSPSFTTSIYGGGLSSAGRSDSFYGGGRGSAGNSLMDSSSLGLYQKSQESLLTRIGSDHGAFALDRSTGTGPLLGGSSGDRNVAAAGQGKRLW